MSAKLVAMNTSALAPSLPVLQWAARRAHLRDDEIQARCSKWTQWLSGEARPTLRQLQDFAKLTHTPIAYFFLSEPPKIELPITDFRTLSDVALRDPSVALLDTIHLCQRQQDWYSDWAREQDLPRVSFVGSAKITDAPQDIAQRMREQFNLSLQQFSQCPTWEDALRQLTEHIESAGVLVMSNSVVGNNNHRPLSISEFRGFALADAWAPLIFINAADSKAAQMFTLAHELAHLWLGESGISDVSVDHTPHHSSERWCNQVAAELLVPLAELQTLYCAEKPLQEEIQNLARHFKVSTLVILRRLHEAGFITQAELWKNYREEEDRLKSILKKKVKPDAGGDFHRTLGKRNSKRFTRALLSHTFEGHTLFQDAFRMLGVHNVETLRKTAQKLGVNA